MTKAELTQHYAGLALTAIYERGILPPDVAKTAVTIAKRMVEYLEIMNDKPAYATPDIDKYICMKDAIHDIVHGAYPCTDKEAWLFVDIARDIAADALNKINKEDGK